jgi:beta-galactosidase
MAWLVIALGFLPRGFGHPPRVKEMSLKSGKIMSRHQRSIRLLDGHWFIDRMPNFQLWKRTAELDSSQMAQLHCPWPAGVWKPVQLPDDFIIGGKFTYRGRKFSYRDKHALHGYLPVYPAWYRRTFSVPATARGKTIWLNFGGVYRDSVVFINGHLVGQHPSGYTGFRYNIGRFLHYRRPNSLAVFVDPRFFEGWWYEGGGIYRHVRLIITDKLHVAPWGTFVISKVPGKIHYGSSAGDQAYAALTIKTTVDNAHRTGRQFTLLSQIVSPQGMVLATISSSESLAAGGRGTFIQHVSIRHAALWSLKHCNLYHLITRLQVQGRTVDDKRTTFGIRTLRFDPNHGFFLDGRHVEIKGTCNHQDFPAVGIGAPDNLWPWRIAKLKAMGSNAYRTTHNPLPEAFYRTCDHLGMLVMDENRHLGNVYTAKTTMGSPYSNLSDLKWMILAQRNDPCVIMWSMCNEEPLQGKAYGARIFAAMKALVQRLDPTRPVTCAMSGGYNKNGFFSVEDLLGINYHCSAFPKIHRRFASKMIFGSEDFNCLSARGVLKTQRKAGLCSEFGALLRHQGGWGANHTPWRSWIPVATHSFVAGDFIWTGFDYPGEPNPFGWPDVTSQTGAMDRCGFAKPCYYYWRAWWDIRKPSVYIFPAWNFPHAMIGHAVRIRCYSNCPVVGLTLNGRSLGRQRMVRLKYVDWTVPYEPGTLTVRGFSGNHVIARYSSETSSAPTALKMDNEVSTLTANGESIDPVAVRVLDAHGILAVNASKMVNFSISGPGNIVGVANGDPGCHESNVENHIRAFHGKCLVMIRVDRKPGVIHLTAKAHGLSAASLDIRVR